MDTTGAHGKPTPATPLSAVPLTADEVRLLFSFLHGDIMDAASRTALRASWGLCSRHAWGHAAVEVELWEATTANGRAHEPLDVLVLTTDLVHEALALLQRPLRSDHAARRLARRLSGQGSCPVCRDLDGGSTGEAALGYAGTDAAELAAVVARQEHLGAWARETHEHWEPAVCPGCMTAAGAPGEGAAAGPLCRRHLIATLRASDAGWRPALERVAAALPGWVRPLRAHLSSLSLPAAGAAPNQATAADRAAWVAALGWLHGWDVPLALRGAPPPSDPAERGARADDSTRYPDTSPGSLPAHGSTDLPTDLSVDPSTGQEPTP